MNRLLLEKTVRLALEEDLGWGDITSEAIFTAENEKNLEAPFIAKAGGVVAGFPVAALVYELVDPRVRCSQRVGEGEPVCPGTVIGTVSGPIRSILSGERVALNFLQRLSGIATKTARLTSQIADLPVRLVDTRKTTPGLRMLEKYAVRQGGGANHRFNLADAVLIKDNHIAACGSIREAVDRARRRIPHTMTIEVETETEAQVREALEAGADIILLDNMTPAQMAEMVRLIDRRAVVEASGNIDERNIREVAATGVDIISSGAITHSVAALDISLKISL
ncbi:nicotinate-nucleotide pyrophosphorylase [carboxylating] [Hydrogenispora ethanolica]|uniref:Probable nicotinate-nucleotide pyrophosphorylase [carboxylating] n=1 Tax=Hydrogenispora ethanolica TaxID=1082276 RepID=A0A4R1RYF3_HYDET|nr:carboxylating nicotinate-nucleotide diphosphorylase [Hydrogenispora ethanolica]TCL71609.1 nicotinate-nucleotide pyrophosphorylase [carboxylating] [Hydrogenispora ethanolica]